MVALPRAGDERPTSCPAGEHPHAAVRRDDRLDGMPSDGAAGGRDDRRPFPHWAARIEDRFHRFRERRGRRRGLTPTIIPYTGYGGAGQVRVLARLLLTRHRPGEEQVFSTVRGWRVFTTIPVVSNPVVEVRLNGDVHEVRPDRGGVIDADVDMDLAPGWHTATLTTAGSEPVEAAVDIAQPDAATGILSDIDDTVMVTALPRPFLAAWNTFVLHEHARRPVTGMAVLYERLARQYRGGPVVYLSTGAWNVAPTLTRFLSRNLYPAGSLLLTDWGPTHDRIFRSGPAHKRASLRRLAAELPHVKWILIGDDGQHDEEIYGDFALEFPQNVKAVCIRQLSAGEAVLAGGRSKASDRRAETNLPWFYAPDGAGLAAQLEEASLLPGDAVVTAPWTLLRVGRD